MMPSSPITITLFLMTERGLEFLRAMTPRYRSLFSRVVVGRDASVQYDFEDAIIEFCRGQSIPWTKRTEHTKVDSDYSMAIAWRWLIEYPAAKLIVFHDSPLPRYRGFAPLVNALVNGETEIGVTAILGAKDFDTGPIIAQSKSEIRYPISIAEAIRLNHVNYLKVGDRVLGRLMHGLPLEVIEQDHASASYSLWRDEYDYEIDWQLPAREIRRFIDAVGFPYRGASTGFEGNRLRILAAEECADVRIENRQPGKSLFVKDGQPVIVCGRGLLRITQARLEDSFGRSLDFLPLSRYRIRFTKSL